MQKVTPASSACPVVPLRLGSHARGCMMVAVAGDLAQVRSHGLDLLPTLDG